MSLMTVGQCVGYVVAVNVITAVWVYICHVKMYSFQTMAKAMYIPTAVALCFCGDYGELIVRVLGLKQPLDAMLYSAVAIYSVAALVGACVILDLFMKWAELNREGPPTVEPQYETFKWGFLRAAGEEVGWRCFLLPSLMSHFSPGVALTLSGVAWGLFHVPVLILMTFRCSPPKPRVTVVVQCLAVALFAFPHGWVAIKSGYSVWACGVMHSVWNQVNPIMLGSIYTQMPGAIAGHQWLINGEGLAGCLVILPVAFWITYSL